LLIRIFPTLPLESCMLKQHGAKSLEPIDWQSFGEDIGNLIVSINVLNVYCVVLLFLSDEVILNINVLGSFVEFWVVNQFDGTLIITEEERRILLSELKFT